MTDKRREKQEVRTEILYKHVWLKNKEYRRPDVEDIKDNK